MMGGVVDGDPAPDRPPRLRRGHLGRGARRDRRLRRCSGRRRCAAPGSRPRPSPPTSTRASAALPLVVVLLSFISEHLRPGRPAARLARGGRAGLPPVPRGCRRGRPRSVSPATPPCAPAMSRCSSHGRWGRCSLRPVASGGSPSGHSMNEGPHAHPGRIRCSSAGTFRIARHEARSSIRASAAAASSMNATEASSSR